MHIHCKNGHMECKFWYFSTTAAMANTGRGAPKLHSLSKAWEREKHSAMQVSNDLLECKASRNITLG